MAAYSEQEPLRIVHFDAHLDFVDERHGVRHEHGNPLRRSSGKSWVTEMTQLGIRNVPSSNRDDYASARAAGSKVFRSETSDAWGPKGRSRRLQIRPDATSRSISMASSPPSHPAPARRATAASYTKRSFKSCSYWSTRARLSASTSSKSPRTMTQATSPPCSPRSY